MKLPVKLVWAILYFGASIALLRRQQQIIPAVSFKVEETVSIELVEKRINPRPLFAYRRTANEGFNMTRAAVSNLVPAHTEFLGFLRISKTASTSVMNLLGLGHGNGSKNGRLSSANTFIAKQHYSKKRSGLNECIFAPSNNASKYSEHWKTKTFNHGCPHPRYKALKMSWLRSLPFLNEADDDGGAHSYYFHPFTMIHLIAWYHSSITCNGHTLIGRQQMPKIN